MDELSDLLNNFNSSKSQNESSVKNRSETETDEKMIENFIRQLTQSSDPVDVNKIPNNEDKEKLNDDVNLQDPPDLDEILKADESSITPTSHNVSVLNAACQLVLKQMEHQLLTLLKKNRKEQEIIQAFLSKNCKNSYNENCKKISLKCAAMPYFKDSDGFQPPLNEDVLRKKRNNKLLPIDFIKGFPIWNRTDAKNLMNAVKKYDLSNPSSIDWMKISATDMEGKYSPSECKSKWTMHLNPSINKSKWSTKEMESLKGLCAKYNYQDWDNIATELGTNRTGLQCCIQYKTHTFPTEGKWTKEEDDALKELVEKYRIKDYIPWRKVVWYFENRSLKQCHERFTYHIGNIKKGNFTMAEDIAIVYLASKLKNFGEVAKHLPKRVATQIRSRYEYLVQLSMPQFSKEEDELLTKLMAKYPRNWAKISESFKDRSRVQCRKRWALLEKKIQLDGEIQSESDHNESEDSTLENNKTRLTNSHIDAENVNKNIQYISKPSTTGKKYVESYKRLLDHHKHCFKFLFGPKCRIPTKPDDLKNLTTKMILTMKKLSVTHIGPQNGFDLNSLKNNEEFEKEDLMVLEELKNGEQQTRGFELSKEFIPPNYMTLIGVRTFLLAWNNIKILGNFYKESPEPRSSKMEISSDDRILFSDAKKLFKSRLKTIFAFPLIFSNISSEEKEKPAYKPKVRKAVKPLSKRKRKEHAKLMSAAYRNKMKAFPEELKDSLIHDDESENKKLKVKNTSKNVEETKSSVNDNEKSRKRPHSSSNDCKAVPSKKRNERKSKS